MQRERDADSDNTTSPRHNLFPFSSSSCLLVRSLLLHVEHKLVADACAVKVAEVGADELDQLAEVEGVLVVQRLKGPHGAAFERRHGLEACAAVVPVQTSKSRQNTQQLERKREKVKYAQ